MLILPVLMYFHVFFMLFSYSGLNHDLVMHKAKYYEILLSTIEKVFHSYFVFRRPTATATTTTVQESQPPTNNNLKSPSSFNNNKIRQTNAPYPAKHS